jgi:hypothetical protein
MAHLEGRRVIHLLDLLGDRLGDLLAAVAGVAAPQARGAVEHLALVDGGVVHALGATNRRGLDLNCRFAVNGIQKDSRLFGEGSNCGRGETAARPLWLWRTSGWSSRPVEDGRTIAMFNKSNKWTEMFTI